MNETTSNAAAITYAPMGTSVSGGCNGLPENPRRPLNVRPRNVSAGRNEKCRTSYLLYCSYRLVAQETHVGQITDQTLGAGTEGRAQRLGELRPGGDIDFT